MESGRGGKMSPLGSLERDYPVIDSGFLNFCAAHRILTVEDFLLHDLDALFASVEKQPSSERLKQGLNQILSLIDGMHSPWLNGVDLLTNTQQRRHVNALLELKSVGSYLYEGLREGFVTELVGPSSSGKTQVCFLAAASIAKENLGSVVYIDTGNSFSAHRIAKFVSKNSTIKDTHKAIQHAMSNILCYPIFSVFSLLELLQQLETELKNQMQARQPLMRLLVVDSLSSLITPVLGGSGPNGHALMVSVGYYLKKLTDDFNLCVLVTNHMVGGGFPKPALGESWKKIPHVRILLSHDHQQINGHKMTLLKHPSMAVKDCSLKLPLV